MTAVRGRRVLQAVFDVTAWFVAYAAAMLLRAEFHPDQVPWGAVLVVAAFSAALQLVIGNAVLLYRGRFPYGSFDEVLGVAETILVTTVFAECLVLWSGLLPPSRPLAAGVFALVIMLALRYTVRLLHERGRRPSDAAVPVVVFGAGEAGRQLIRSIQLDPSSPYRVVAVLDDDPALANLTVFGIRVSGGRDHLVSTVKKTGAQRVVVALPNASAALLRAINAEATYLDLPVKVLPSLVVPRGLNVMTGGWFGGPTRNVRIYAPPAMPLLSPSSASPDRSWTLRVLSLKIVRR